MLKQYLLAPGPTPIPPEVLLAMARPMIHHRAPEFDPIFAEVREGLKWLFQTRNDVLMLASSGNVRAVFLARVSRNACDPGLSRLVVNMITAINRPQRSHANDSRIHRRADNLREVTSTESPFVIH